MTTSALVLALVSLAVGLVIGWLAASQRMSAHAGRADSRAEAAQARLEAAEDQLRRTSSDRDALATQFRALSADALAAQDARSHRAAERTMADAARLLAPVTRALERLDTRLDQVERERTAMSSSLSEQVRSVGSAGEELRRQTASLVTALRRPEVRGSWGEMQLRKVVELAGLVEHCDFDTQQTTTASGRALRPDLTVWLTEGRCIHVDSKAPLTAFLDATQADTDEARAEGLRTFAAHVRHHVDDLSRKRYWATDTTPEFVVLFLPSDAFLQAALQQQPDLHDHAARHDIVLASPSVLIPMLRAVALAWRQDAVARSAVEVSAAGRELHSRLATMASHLDKLGRSLTSAVGAYNSTLGSLETRVLVSARRFESLGVTTDHLDSPTPVDAAVRPLTAPELTADELPNDGPTTDDKPKADDLPSGDGAPASGA